MNQKNKMRELRLAMGQIKTLLVGLKKTIIKRRKVGLAVMASILLAACAENAAEEAAEEKVKPPKVKIESIVVLGDSVASGEGINYEYTYYHNNFSNYISHWRGGTKEPTWAGPYPLCHDSNAAYGNVLAQKLDAKLAKFACTGATYDNGLIGAHTVGAQEYRPAEFGDWSTQESLNAEYDAAKPDLVVLTFGADDVNFIDILKFCMTGYSASEAARIESMGSEADVKAEIHENYVDRHAKQEFLEGDRNVRDTLSSSSFCTAENPGAPIQKLFWEPLNSGLIATNYQAMVKAIQARGEQAGKVPQIVFTTYHNPVPRAADPDDCFDLADLDRAEMNYLNVLQDALNKTIVDAVGSMPGVAIADISNVMDGHKWCSVDPWTYGMTALIKDSKSLAPFHPTPAGQKAIAEIVRAAVE